MKLVIDANVLFSALLKDSATRLLMADRRLELVAPAFLLDELSKYEAELMRRAKLREERFRELEALLMERIRVVPDSDLKPFLPAADAIVDDAKDALYAACALLENADVWSNDRHFSNRRIRAWKTAELFNALYKE